MRDRFIEVADDVVRGLHRDGYDMPYTALNAIVDRLVAAADEYATSAKATPLALTAEERAAITTLADAWGECPESERDQSCCDGVCVAVRRLRALVARTAGAQATSEADAALVRIGALCVVGDTESAHALIANARYAGDETTFARARAVVGAAGA